MTDEPQAAPANQPVAASDILIHQVLSRGRGEAAQVLLVLVSTSAPEAPDYELWVGLGVAAPRAIWSDRTSPGIEMARPVAWDELVLLDQTIDPENAKDRRPFDIDPTAGRRYGLARFDFSDHLDLGETWRAVVQGGAAPTPGELTVASWHARVEKRLDFPSGNPYQELVPQPGHASVEVKAADVVAQALFDLGVLFVHGIGNRQPRETLVLWAEPIVKFWRDLTRAITEGAQDHVARADRITLQRAIFRGQLLNRGPQDGISQAVGDFANASSGGAARIQRAMPSRDGHFACIAAVKAEQTLFEDPTGAHDSATLLRISTVDSGAVLRESHVLFSEAYWTRESFAPTFSELFLWLTTATPIAVWAEMRRVGLTRYNELRERFQTDTGIGARTRLTIDTGVWAAQLMVMPAVYILGALLSQMLIGVFGLLGLIVPIPWVRAASRTLVNALMGTLGQSFSLQLSPIRRSAVVSIVQSRLDWMSAQCRPQVVVSHSQGAEVTRRVFGERYRSDIARWYTFGAGIAPLNMLHPKNIEKDALKRVARSSQLLLIVSMGCLLALAVDAIPGVDIGLVAWLWQRMQWVTLSTVAVTLVCVSVLGLALGNAFSPEALLTTRRSVMARWRNLYASNDPVSGGSLFARFSTEMRERKLPIPEERQIFNTRFALLDHTSYWKNVEQFVAPIALDLLGLMGQGFDQSLEASALEGAAHRRDLMTWWMQMVCLAAGLASAGLAYGVAFGSPARAAAWWTRGGDLWQRGTGFFDSLRLLWSGGFVGQVISDLATPLAILLGLLALAGVRAMLGSHSSRRLVDDLAGR